VLAVVGVTATAVLALGGHATGSGHPPGTRWFWADSPLDDRSLGRTPAIIVARVALAALAGAWLGAGMLVSRHRLPARGVLLLAVVWSLPLLAAAPLFSDDAHAYVAFGDLVRRGFDPYTSTPSELGALPDALGVNGFWQQVPTPYGGLFLDLMGLIVRLTGEHEHLALLVLRLVEVLALGALSALLVRLAAVSGHRPESVLWLAVLNPLVLLSTVSGLHNDVLMLVPLMGAVLLAVRGRQVWAIAACAVAADVKVIALVTLAVIVAAHAWRADPWLAKVRRLSGGAALGVVLFGAATLATWQGFGWVRDLDVPARAFNYITPVDDVLAIVGQRSAGWLRDVAMAITVVVALASCVVCRRTGLLRGAGLALAGAVLLGVVVWPWYWMWPLLPLAVAGTYRERRAMVVGSVLLLFVSLPSGVPDFGTGHSWLLGAHAVEAVTFALCGLLTGVLVRGAVRPAISRSALVGRLRGLRPEVPTELPAVDHHREGHLLR